MFFEESDRLVEQCSSLLNMGLGVMCGEICIRLAFFLESFCKTLLKTKKKKMIDDVSVFSIDIIIITCLQIPQISRGWPTPQKDRGLISAPSIAIV